ncbi:hypothetical protein [Derxia gummosa]|uniref:Uncharacterized protein n=1 Tax=Derxia gummosa DSM 723 TaxID=1121388 RepID=A0A9U5C6K2_9BURK|nr:hypothetical protein [Derxia gummosa]
MPRDPHTARAEASPLHRAETAATRLARLLLRAAEEDMRLMVMRGVVASVGAVVATLGLIGLIVVAIVLLWDTWAGVALAVATPLALLVGGIGALMWADRERESLTIELGVKLREMVAESLTPSALLRQFLRRSAGASTTAPTPGADTATGAELAGAMAANAARGAAALAPHPLAAAIPATGNDDDFNRRVADAIEAELERRRRVAREPVEPEPAAAYDEAAHYEQAAPSMPGAGPTGADHPAAPPTTAAPIPAAPPDLLTETVGLAVDAFGLSRRARLWLMVGASAGRLVLAERAVRSTTRRPGPTLDDATLDPPVVARPSAEPSTVPASDIGSTDTGVRTGSTDAGVGTSGRNSGTGTPVADLPASAIVAAGTAAGASVIAGGAGMVERAADRIAGLADDIGAIAHDKADRAEARARAAEAETEAIAPATADDGIAPR